MKRRILAAVLLVAVLAGFAWLVLGTHEPPEPVYDGKPLSAWLEIYDPSSTNRSAAQLKASEKAILEMGTNAFPTLLRMMATRDSRLKAMLFSIAEKQHIIPIHYVPPLNRYERARIAFEILGPRANSAVPGLVRIYNQHMSNWSQQMIAGVFGNIGPGARGAVPSLLNSLADRNQFVSGDAILALGRIHAEPGSVVPALTKCLGDPDPSTRTAAARSLGNFGAEAKSAIPALMQALNDPDYAVRYSVSNALRAIDPEASAKAGVK